MNSLNNFEAAGVSFHDSSREDLDGLLEKIPETGLLHLAILKPPYLDLIADGTKTIESRFNTKRAAPYGKVSVGDLILLKGTGKPITHYFFAASVVLFDLTETPVEYIRENYAEGIQAQNEDVFWEERTTSRYATLVGVGDRGSIPAMPVIKRDQRGWVTFQRKENASVEGDDFDMDNFLRS